MPVKVCHELGLEVSHPKTFRFRESNTCYCKSSDNQLPKEVEHQIGVSNVNFKINISKLVQNWRN